MELKLLTWTQPWVSGKRVQDGSQEEEAAHVCAGGLSLPRMNEGKNSISI